MTEQEVKEVIQAVKVAYEDERVTWQQTGGTIWVWVADRGVSFSKDGDVSLDELIENVIEVLEATR